jgi:hypothetical protein
MWAAIVTWDEEVPRAVWMSRNAGIWSKPMRMPAA